LDSPELLQTALFYIGQLATLMDEVNTRISGSLDKTQRVSNLNRIMQEYVLESIGIMFLGVRLGVLQGSPIGHQMFQACNAHFEVFFQTTLLPRRLARLTPMYWRLVAAWQTIMAVCRGRAAEAAAGMARGGSEAARLEATVLGLLIQKCGAESQMPAVVAADAFIAGIGKTKDITIQGADSPPPLLLGASK
jgi:hypothetical protein